MVRLPRRPDPRAPPRAGEEAERQPAGHRRKRLGRRLAGLDQPGVDRRRHQVFQQFGVAVGQQLGLDPHGHDLEPAVDLGRDAAAAGGPFDLDLAQGLGRLLDASRSLPAFRIRSARFPVY